MLWEYSEHGVPRLINKIAKLCLKAGETNDFQVITSEVVQQIGERFDKMTGPAVQKRRIAETRVPQTPKKEIIKAKPAKEDSQRIMAVEKEKAPVFWPPPPPPPPPKTAPEPEIVPPSSPPRREPSPSRFEIPQEKLFIKKVEEREFKEEPEESVEEPIIEKVTPPPPPPPKTAPEHEIVPPPPRMEPSPLRLEIPQEKPSFEKVEEEKIDEKEFKEEPEENVEEPIIEKAEPSIPTPPPSVETIFKPVKEIGSEARVPVHPPEEKAIEAEVDKDSVTIAGCKINIEIPPHILEQAQLANSEQKKKIAGVLAAQTLEKNPQLIALPTVDPVSVWSDILNAIMNKIG
jgi:hypothetical protein